MNLSYDEIQLICAGLQIIEMRCSEVSVVDVQQRALVVQRCADIRRKFNDQLIIEMEPGEAGQAQRINQAVSQILKKSGH